MVLLHSMRPRLHRSGVCKWMIWCSINSAYSFITCVIAIDLPDAASGGFVAAECKALHASMIHHAIQNMLHRKQDDLAGCMGSQRLYMQIQIIVIDGKDLSLFLFQLFFK